MGMYFVDADWSGSWPSLCFGQWTITIDDVVLAGVGNDHMNTKGDYSSWSFGENWDEKWTHYEDGLEFEDWKHNIPNNLGMAIHLAGFDRHDEVLLREVYDAVSANDWRSSSCGGCI